MQTVVRGRPRVQDTADDIVASVLATAGPRVGGTEFSTRRIAELTGLSQTLVSRAVRRIRHPGQSTQRHAATTAASPAAQRLRLMAFRVEYPRITLEFGTSASAAAPARRRFERRATALMAALWVSGAAAWTDPPRNSAAEPPGAEPSSLRAQWSPGADWEEFLVAVAALLDRCEPSEAALPGSLLRLLAARAGRGLLGVHWRAETESSGTDPVSDSNLLAVMEYPAPDRSPANRWLPRMELSATEQLAIALRKEMINSGFRPGDRLRPALFAQRLGLPPATVRTAMRQLADDGLLVQSSTGAASSTFRIPRVTGADVIDLYASRLHVGMVLLRACAAQPRHRLLPARLALGALEAAAAQGTRADVGEADLRFQQELAEASGLRQSARSFHALTLRVRMFIAVLQLDYTPAVDRLLRDDRRILTAVLEGRGDGAVRLWRGKLDNAVRHMSALAPESFDAALWDRLTR